MPKIRRGPLPQDDFAIISNAAMRDARLSIRARGLLAILSTHADGFEVSVRGLQTPAERRDAVLTAVRELEGLGYLVRDPDRRGPGGRFTPGDWRLVDPHRGR